jgi:hypothetical protein
MFNTRPFSASKGNILDLFPETSATVQCDMELTRQCTSSVEGSHSAAPKPDEVTLLII